MSIGIKDGRRTVVVQPDWYPKADGTERAVVFQPGYNGDRTGDPRRDYGVHGMEITWYLRGPKGCVTLTVTVPMWVPGNLYPGHGLPPAGEPHWADMHNPHGFGVRYCAPVAQYEGQEPSRDDCPFIGVPCYADRYLSGADEPASKFTEFGDAVMWAALETFYLNLEGVSS